MLATVTIDLTAEASRDMPASGGETTVEVTVDPVSKTQPTTRHIAILIDTSGSMSGNKIQNAKSGAKQALDKLDGDDYVSIVGFDSGLKAVQQMTQWGNLNQRRAENKIEDIQSGGGTDIYKGLEKVRDQLIKDAPETPGAVKRIILLSDGQDRYDADTYRDLAEEYDEEGISIIAAGIGQSYDGQFDNKNISVNIDGGGYDEQVMLALANGSGGEAFDLAEDDIDNFLSDTVEETDSVVVPNPSLEIEPEQGFIVTDDPAYFDAPKFEKRPIDRDEPATLGLPELQVGDPHRFTFNMLGQPKSAGLMYDLAELHVVDSTGSTLAETTVEVEYTGDGGIAQVDAEKRRAASKVRADIQDPDVSKAAVDEGIEAVRDRGWDKKAAELERAKEKVEEGGTGGIIRMSKDSAGIDES